VIKAAECESILQYNESTLNRALTSRQTSTTQL